MFFNYGRFIYIWNKGRDKGMRFGDEGGGWEGRGKDRDVKGWKG